jgi:hypothetical protein
MGCMGVLMMVLSGPLEDASFATPPQPDLTRLHSGFSIPNPEVLHQTACAQCNTYVCATIGHVLLQIMRWRRQQNGGTSCM